MYIHTLLLSCCIKEYRYNMEAKALHDFIATTDDELSFKKGAVLKILQRDSDDQWLTAEQDGKSGLVPQNYIQMKETSWFEGRISRLEAETLLKNQEHDGAFLVRECESSPGDFSLSVSFGGNILHFKVSRDGAGKYFLWVVKFDSLNQLVDYHRTSSVSRTQQIYLKDREVKPADQYRALFDFTAQESGLLTLKKGDVIDLVSKNDAGWWRGKCGGNEGDFPGNYVEAIRKH